MSSGFALLLMLGTLGFFGYIGWQQPANATG